MVQLRAHYARPASRQPLAASEMHRATNTHLPSAAHECCRVRVCCNLPAPKGRRKKGRDDLLAEILRKTSPALAPSQPPVAVELTPRTPLCTKSHRHTPRRRLRFALQLRHSGEEQYYEVAEILDSSLARVSAPREREVICVTFLRSARPSGAAARADPDPPPSSLEQQRDRRGTCGVRAL